MKLVVFALLVSVLVADQATGQSCTAKPETGQFHLSRPRCDAAAPCLPGRSMQLQLAKNTSCYPWYAPCPGYTIQSCDTVEWSFGDGTTVTTTGNSSMSHTFAAPGLYSIDAKVTNLNGSGVASTAVIIAAEPVALVTFAESIVTVPETAGSVTVRLKRTGDTTRRVMIDYRTGYAIGTVYRNLEIVEGKVVFETGETTKTVSIPVIDDQVYEGDTEHTIWIECYTGEALLPSVFMGDARIRIVDNEPAPTATAASTVSVPEGDSGATLLKVPVTLSRTFSEDVQLWWTIWEESAKREIDWAPPPPHGLMSGALIIPAGATRGDLSVLILGDSNPEQDETFRIEFFRSGVVAVVAVGSPVRVTIVDDDIAFSSEAALIPAGQTLQLRLRTAAMPTATIAELDSTDPSIAEVPSSLSVSAGSTNTGFMVKAGQPGTADIRATLAGTTLTTSSRVTVYQPLVASFERGAVEVGERRSTSVTLQIDPPPDAPVTATLKSAPASLIQIPSTVTVPTNGKASVRIDGRTAGSAVVTATLAQSPGQPSATLSVIVVERDRPTLSSVGPAGGPTTGETNVTLRGENFAQACSVLFGDLFATVLSLEASKIVAVTPPHAAGAVDVSLVCGSRTAVLSNAFAYVPSRRRAVR